MNHFIYITILILSLFSSCYTANVLQTAKPIEVGSHEITSGLAFNSLNRKANYPGEIFPGALVMYRTGLFQNADLGLTYSPSLAIGDFRADVKYNFLKDQAENTFVSGLFSLEFSNPLSFDKEFWAFSSGIGIIGSFNHQKRFNPFVYQKLAFGLNDITALSLYRNQQTFQEHLHYSHLLHYVGGTGLKYRLKENGRTHFVMDFSYFIRQNTVFTNFQGYQENDLVFSSNSRRDKTLNFQISMSLAFELRGKNK
jgi:hypothetical protein